MYRIHVVIFTGTFGKSEFDHATRKKASGKYSSPISRLQESEISIDAKEKDPWNYHAKVVCSNMQYVEEDIESVEMVGVEENFEHLSSNRTKACNPHSDCKYCGYRPCYV